MAEINVKGGKEAARREGATEGAQTGPLATPGGPGRGLQPGGGVGGWGWRSPFSMSPLELWTAGPFELMRRMSDEMDRMMQGWGAPTGARGNLWTPAVEVFERDSKLAVRAELPGLSKDDVRVEATDEGLVRRASAGKRRRSAAGECSAPSATTAHSDA